MYMEKMIGKDIIQNAAQNVNEYYTQKKDQLFNYQPVVGEKAINISQQPTKKIKLMAKTIHGQAAYTEDSCDIETERYYKKNAIINYSNPFNNFTPIGGSDWRFLTTIPCINLNETIFVKSSEEKEQLIPTCYENYVHIERSRNSKYIHVFNFPDKCLKRVVSKFCSDNLPVPNIVHYIWFGKQEFEFVYFVSFYSAHKNQNPCLIFLYYDVLPFGKWWDILVKLVTNIVYVKVTPPAEILGKKINWVQHKADIMRLRILKEYGGIYLDTDQYVLRSLNAFRNKDCTMGAAHDGSMASALIFAVENATFINKWIDSYASYNPNVWGENSVTMARKLSIRYPQHVRSYEHHCLFFPHGYLLFNQNYKWSHCFGIHLYGKRPRWNEIRKWSLVTIQKLNNTIGAVFRYILFGHKDLCN
ncbi:uncharacterized protein LOC133187681 [Saccostrea echinata]|uniref:uncharacterized protein LOC133187681 n=1 Tax=Saccostrea echinata TaxID=191078 RepID=UPI002A815233|nr:uncharacterized protein LOC133187681 [Saccostrea echinata]